MSRARAGLLAVLAPLLGYAYTAWAQDPVPVTFQPTDVQIYLDVAKALGLPGILAIMAYQTWQRGIPVVATLSESDRKFVRRAVRQVTGRPMPDDEDVDD